MNPAPPAFRYSSPSSSSASVPMVVITVVGILAAFALLASYYAFVTKCQLLRSVLSSRSPQWRREPSTAVVRAAVAEGEDRRGLGLPLIRMLPVVKFTAEDAAAAARISVSACGVCLSEFAERERVRLLPNCSHAFHIDCIDTWLQGSARCPFCRSDVTAPHPPPWRRSTAPTHHRVDDMMRAGDRSIVIEVRGERERWVTPASGRRARKAESVGDEAIDTRRKKDGEFAVLPMRRSLSMDSSCDKQLYVSVVQELLITQQRSHAV